MTQIEARIENSNDRFREIKPFLDEIVFRPGARVLDIGGGTGWASQYFIERGLYVTLIDYDFSTLGKLDERIIRIEADFRDLSDLEPFDIVFISHVLEHFSNPGQVVDQIRKILVEGGMLIAVVPKYTPFATEGHWHSGWNVVQLGNFLANSGFDCTKSVFQKTGLSVCGFGFKNSESYVNEESSLERTLFYMPQVLKDFKVNEDIVYADFKYLETNHAILERPAVHVDIHDIDLVMKSTNQIQLDLPWWELFFDLDFSTLGIQNRIKLVLNYSGNSPTKARIIIGFYVGGHRTIDAYENHADHWFEFEPGINILELARTDFELRKGEYDWDNVSSISLGGNQSLGKCTAEIYRIN